MVVYPVRAAVLLAAVMVGGLLRAQTPGELRASAAMAKAAKSPLELRAFLYTMPKGGDLHYHLSNGPYAETLIDDAAADNLCVNMATHGVVANIGMTKDGPVCAEGLVPASTVAANNAMRDAVIDAWSMRSFVPSQGVSGHDHFFSGPLRREISNSHAGEWLDIAATRAAAQNEDYLELMITEPYPNTLAAVKTMQWTGDMAAMRAALVAAARKDVPAAEAGVEAMESSRKERERCGTPQAEAACAVTVRYLQTMLHERGPMEAFAEYVFAFELVSAEQADGKGRVVGLNMAQPEDWVVSMREFHRQMTMLDYLHGVYPKVHIALHAGELAFGMVPPEEHFHVREAVELGHAERIGHGVDVMYEKDPQQLLREMAAKHVMVEVNLTSNDVILGVTGKQHPLPIYLKNHVPVALSTDDEGTSRIDLTHEYQRAAQEFGLGYVDLKRSARTSIEHSFLAGESLWASEDDFGRMVPACAVSSAASCASFLKGSDKARVQMDLEMRFKGFEAKQ